MDVNDPAFCNAESRHFAVAQTKRDQIEDYVHRTGKSVTDVERWLAANLRYDAD